MRIPYSVFYLIHLLFQFLMDPPSPCKLPKFPFSLSLSNLPNWDWVTKIFLCVESAMVHVDLSVVASKGNFLFLSQQLSNTNMFSVRNRILWPLSSLHAYNLSKLTLHTYSMCIPSPHCEFISATNLCIWQFPWSLALSLFFFLFCIFIYLLKFPSPPNPPISLPFPHLWLLQALWFIFLNDPWALQDKVLDRRSA